MPMRKEQKALYPKDWETISRRVRDRAGNRCEQCRAPNGNYLGNARDGGYPTERVTKIVLTTAHLNHDPADCRDSNLRAWCQKCRLGHDRAMHREGRARRRREARAVADLF
jgi:hypothetical protein